MNNVIQFKKKSIPFRSKPENTTELVCLHTKISVNRHIKTAKYITTPFFNIIYVYRHAESTQREEVM